jgi:hypothetical protein
VNTIDVLPGFSGTSYGFNFNGNPAHWTIPDHIDLQNNTVNTALLNDVPTSVGYYSGNTGNGFPSQPNDGWMYSPARSDLDQDGNVDIVLQDADLCMKSYSVSNAVASSAVDISPRCMSQAGWQLVGTGDFNSDGKTDLVFQHDTYGVGVWTLDGHSWFPGGGPVVASNSVPVVPGGTWKVVAVADLDGDNKPDLIWQDTNTYLGVWHLNGLVVRDMAPLNPVWTGGVDGWGGRWKVVGSGDYGGAGVNYRARDGKLDFLLQYDGLSNTNYDGTLGVWFMNDTSLIGATLLNPASVGDPKYRVAASGGFFHTSDVDILFQYKDPRAGWGGGLLMWSMSFWDLMNSYTVNPGSPLSVGAFNVCAPR